MPGFRSGRTDSIDAVGGLALWTGVLWPISRHQHSESRAAALAAYLPKAQAAVRAAGGTPGVIATGKIIAVTGDPPKRIGASEWPSAEQAQAYLKSPQRAALDSDRAKAFKTTRQFIVERPN